MISTLKGSWIFDRARQTRVTSLEQHRNDSRSINVYENKWRHCTISLGELEYSDLTLTRRFEVSIPEPIENDGQIRHFRRENRLKSWRYFRPQRSNRDDDTVSKWRIAEVKLIGQ